MKNYVILQEPVKLKTIILDKRYMNSKSQLNKAISIEINKFIKENQSYFDSFEKIVIYYSIGLSFYHFFNDKSI